jgi:hypothetical protein
MEPNDDLQLRGLLKEWRAPEAPASLNERVLGRRDTWWGFLLRGSIRVPVPVACVLALLMAAGAWQSVKTVVRTGTCVAVNCGSDGKC